MIQDKSPEEFFARYVVNASTIRSSVLEGGQDVAVAPPRSTVAPPRSAVAPRSEKKASIANTNQIATKATDYNAPGPTAARKKRTMIYVCIGIVVLIGIAAAAVFFFVPVK